MSLHVVAFCGSLRTESHNRKLLALAVKELEAKNVTVDVIDLKTLVLPIYDADLEKGALPGPVTELKERIAKANGLLFVSPEYNFSIPGGLKNAIDWVSCPPKPPFRGKVAALMGASTGVFGTIRMQPHMRQVLEFNSVWVIHPMVLLPKAQEAFDEQGQLKDEMRRYELKNVVSTLLYECKLRALAARAQTS